MRKDELRKSGLDRRKTMPPAEASRLSSTISDNFFASVDLQNVELLHTFIRIRKFNEIDTSMICYRVWRDFPCVRMCAPRVDLGSGDMVQVVFDSSTNLTENRWGIREPATGYEVAPGEIDMVLVPGLAFDRYGHRVGYGKGFYDRFLQQTRPDCLKIGLSFSNPVDMIDDVYEGDVAVDLIITPVGKVTTA